MKKKKVLINLLLIIILIDLLALAWFFGKKVKIKNEQNTGEVVLREIGYNSSVLPVGYKNANGILSNFIEAYNAHDGKGVAQLMNLVATYIYSNCENKDEFDKAYEEKLSIKNEVDDIVLMQYTLQKQEAAIIDGIDKVDVKLTLLENSEIEDKSKYLSKMTAKIRTVSKVEQIDQVDTLEFVLLHRNDAYYIMEYNLIETN